MDNRLGDFLTALNGTQSVDRATGLTVEFMRNLGASQVNFVMNLDGNDPLIVKSCPDWVEDMYREEIHPHYDPVINNGRNKPKVCFTGKAFEGNDPHLPTPRRRFIEETADADMRSMAKIPVNTFLKRDWGFFGFITDLGAHDFARLYDEHGNTIHMAGIMAFNHIQALQKNEEAIKIGLTLTERECLLWLAHGLRKDQIAERLDTHLDVVETYLAGAQLKLEAFTLEQALATAVQRGLVTP